MDLEAIVRAEIGAVLRELPPEVRSEAVTIPVTCKDLPSPEMELDGVAPDTLGLLAGGNRNEEAEGFITMPVQIFFFLENLWTEAGGRHRTFKEEVRITYLHELGHYLGLEEEDMEPRGLA